LQYLASSYLSLPQKPGVYLLLDNSGEVLYVGKAKQLKNRVSSYFANPSQLLGKTRALVSQVKKIKVIIVESELESLLLEANLIKKYAPKYNVRLTDGKAYPLIRITLKDTFPAVVTARRPEDAMSLYFGPYPNAKAMHTVLRILRRIFPFQSTINHSPKVCLYHHLNLCPCINALPTEENKKTYKKNLHYIIDFLEGKTKKVISDLEKERGNASENENFEQAAILQKQIDAIFLITSPVHSPFEYETNPNLRSDVREQEMKSLQEILMQNNVHISFPLRIECYDNSNIQGTNPTSSMVVLTNGEIDKSQYRKFKIKTVKGPNDFASMQEVLQRRIKHTEWPFPQLFVVDGGKGQISAAKEVLAKNGITIPLIGLAKREETLITSDFREIHLPKHAKALQLIMRIRDEAHRFAITYHRKLRSSATFE
jgi:excinuclease ABC subunit C